MDMRCDSVDIATFLGVSGMATTRVNRGNRHKHNETKQGYLAIWNSNRLESQLAVVNRLIYVVLIGNKKHTRRFTRDQPKDGSSKVNDNQNHHISV